MSVIYNSYYRYDNEDLFEKIINKTNNIWLKTFNNKYEKNECPAPYLSIGTLNEEIVSACIYELFEEECIISCVCGFPYNNGYGTGIMNYVIKYIKENIIVKKIIINIDNDKYDTLSKFYNRFGFTIQDIGDMDEDNDYETSMEYIITNDNVAKGDKRLCDYLLNYSS